MHIVCRFAEEKQKNQMDMDGKSNLHWICGYGGHMTTYGAVGQARERGRGKPKSKNSCLLFCRSKLSLATDIRQKAKELVEKEAKGADKCWGRGAKLQVQRWEDGARVDKGDAVD